MQVWCKLHATSPQRAAFNGLALAIVHTKQGQAGKLVLTASSEGMGSAQVNLSRTVP